MVVFANPAIHAPFGSMEHSPSYDQINNTTSERGVHICIPWDGTIEKVAMTILYINGTSPEYTLRLVNMKANGLTNTLISAGARALFTPSVSGVNEFDLDTPAPVTAGQHVGIKFRHNSGTIDFSNYITFNDYYQETYLQMLGAVNAGTSSNSGSTWTDRVAPGAFSLIYDDGRVAPLTLTQPEYAGYYYQSVDINTTPDEVGVRFNAYDNVRCIGVKASVRPESTASTEDLKLILYQNTTNLTEATVTTSQIGTSKLDAGLFFFEDSIRLTAATEYIVAAQPQGNINWSIGYHNNVGAAYVTSQLMKSTAVERTNAGAWSVAAPSANYFLYPIFDVDAVPAVSSGGSTIQRFSQLQFGLGLDL